MSSRALRRALRDKEERERLQQRAREDDDEPAMVPPKRSAFALLQEDDGGPEEDGGELGEGGDGHGEDGDGHGEDGDGHGEDGDEHGEDGDKHREDGDKHREDGDEHGEDGDKHGEDGDEHGEDGDKHREDGDAHREDAPAHDTPRASHPPQPAAKKEPKKKKKKKKKQQAKEGANAPAAHGHDSEIDEIDAALKSLSTTGPTPINPAADEAHRMLAIDTAHLHAVNEMKRLFGRAALDPDHEDQRGPAGGVGANRRQQRRGQRFDARSGGLAAMALRRNPLMQGKEEWPGATGGGLGMEVEEQRADGTVLYQFVHNRAYQDVQRQFEACVASMDPERLILLLRLHPYHISSLLQASEIAKHQRDHAASADLLERALFSFGRALHSTFAKKLAEGKARLDFRRAENREFWLAGWRYIQNLTMRATWRTVYEWAKMLLSLSPEHDPYALWLVLDQYAMRSRQDLDYLNLSRNPSLKGAHEDMSHVPLSQALAECRAGNKPKGQQLLFTAIGRYPWVVARLMQELNLDAPPAVWGKEPPSMKEKLYTELYATRAKDVWSTPENTNLLVETASAVPPETSTAAPDSRDITQNVARHVMLSDTPALIALLPRHFTTQLTSASDPVPPDDAFTSYRSPRPSSDRPGGDGLVGTARYHEETDEEMMRQLLAAVTSAERLLQNHVHGESSDAENNAFHRPAVEPRIPDSDHDQHGQQLIQHSDRRLVGDLRTLSRAELDARMEEGIGDFVRRVDRVLGAPGHLDAHHPHARPDDASDADD